MEFILHKWKYLKETEVINIFCMFSSVLFCYFFSPFLSVLAALLFLSIIFENDKIRMLFLLVIFLCLYSMLIFFKPISGDWNWYTQHYRALQYLDFFSYYGHAYGPFTIKFTEPVYYFLSFVLSRATGANVTVLAVLLSVVFYSVFIFSLFKLSRYFTITAWQQNIIALAAVLFSVTPTLVLHLVRQEMASVLLFCGFTLLLCGNKRSAFFVMIFSVFTHQSAVIVLGIYIVSYLFSKLPLKGGWLLAFLASLMIGLFYVKSGYFISEDNSGKGDGAVNPLVYLYDAILLFLFLFSMHSLKLKSSVKNIFYIFVASYMGFLLGVSSEPLPLLRMYFYVEWFRAFFIVLILSRMASFIYFNALSFFILLLGGFYTNYRISSSDLGFPLSIYSFVNRSIQSWMYLF
jgi:EpsG family